MKNAFKLVYRNTGVFLEILDPKPGLTPPTMDRLKDYFTRKQLNAVKTTVVEEAVQKGAGTYRVAEPQPEYVFNEELRIGISTDSMTARAILLPPDENGGRSITVSEAIKQLNDEGVKFGIDQEAIEKVLTEKIYGKPFIAAKGEPAVDGVNGKITFHFSMSHTGKPVEDEESGRVDFHYLDNFEKVKEGQLLVSRTFATQGTVGSNVRGISLNPAKGKEAKMPKGQKIRYNEDYTEMYAAATGRVDYRNELVIVSNVYEVKQDVDLSTGNIEFEGDVLIRKNVTSGMEIKASGDIIVYGGVENARLIAGHSITVTNGFQGGSASAGSEFSAKFIEGCDVYAGELIKSDSVMFSTLNCGGEIIIYGKRGSIIGGEVKAYHLIAAKTIGAVNPPKTKVYVGIDPKLKDKLVEVEDKLEKANAQFAEVEKVCKYLLSKAFANDTIRDQTRRALASKAELSQQISDYQHEREEIVSLLSDDGNGVVHVTEMAYPGTIITISEKVYNVEGSGVKAASFRVMSDMTVGFTVCDYSPTSAAKAAKK